MCLKEVWIVTDFKCNWIRFLVKAVGILAPQHFCSSAVCSSWLSGNSFLEGFQPSHSATAQSELFLPRHIFYTPKTSHLLQSQKKSSTKATVTCTPPQVFYSWNKDHEPGKNPSTVFLSFIYWNCKVRSYF